MTIELEKGVKLKKGILLTRCLFRALQVARTQSVCHTHNSEFLSDYFESRRLF